MRAEKKRSKCDLPGRCDGDQQSPKSGVHEIDAGQDDVDDDESMCMRSASLIRAASDGITTTAAAALLW
jgi:hypothetical protein